MNNNRLVTCVGFSLFVISLLLSIANSTIDVEMYIVISLALMVGGQLNEALGEK